MISVSVPEKFSDMFVWLLDLLCVCAFSPVIHLCFPLNMKWNNLCNHFSFIIKSYMTFKIGNQLLTAVQIVKLHQPFLFILFSFFKSVATEICFS